MRCIALGQGDLTIYLDKKELDEIKKGNNSAGKIEYITYKKEGTYKISYEDDLNNDMRITAKQDVSEIVLGEEGYQKIINSGRCEIASARSAKIRVTTETCRIPEQKGKRK